MLKINIYKSRQFNIIVSLLFYSTIFLLPYDAIRIMPSVYKPICLIPATLLFFVLLPKIWNTGFTNVTSCLTIFVVTAIFNTIICDLTFVGTFTNFLDFFITIALLYFSFFSISYVFNYFSQNYDVKKYTFFFFQLLAWAYILPTFVLVLDALSVYHILPFAVKTTIVKIFGGNQLSRITGTSFESSWLTFHLLISVVAFLYVFKHSSRVKYLFLAILVFAIFILTFSLQGFIVLGIALLIYFILHVKTIRASSMVIIAFLAIASFAVFFIVLRRYDGDNYFISRFREFVDIGTLFKSDLSTFVRIGYPYIGIRMFFDNPVLGVGGSNFGIFFGDYIYDLFPWAPNFYGTNNNEVYLTIVNQSGNTKNLYARLLCEFGFFPSAMFFTFLYSGLRKRNKSTFAEILIILSLTFLLQFDSLCFALFIVPFAFYSELPYKYAKCASNENNVLTQKELNA